MLDALQEDPSRASSVDWDKFAQDEPDLNIGKIRLDLGVQRVTPDVSRETQPQIPDSFATTPEPATTGVSPTAGVGTATPEIFKNALMELASMHKVLDPAFEPGFFAKRSAIEAPQMAEAILRRYGPLLSKSVQTAVGTPRERIMAPIELGRHIGRMAEEAPIQTAFDVLGAAGGVTMGLRGRPVAAATPKPIIVNPPKTTSGIFRDIPQGIGRLGETKVVDYVRRAVSESRNRIKSPEGKSLIAEMEDVRADRYGLAGTYTTAYRMVKNKPTGNNITQQLSRKTLITKPGREIRAILDQVAKDAQDAGIQVMDKDGNLKPFTLRENYVPRRLKEDVRRIIYDDMVGAEKQLVKFAETSQGQISQGDIGAMLNRMGKPAITGKQVVKLNPKTTEAINHIAKEQNIDFAKAYRMLQRFLDNETYNPFGNLEKARTVELPSGFYETDFNKLFPDYIMGASRAISEVRKWGSDRAKITNKIVDLMRKNPAEGDLVNQMYELSTGLWEKNRPLSSVTKQAINAFVNYEVVTKIGLGTAAIPNITQTLISTGVKAPWHRAVRGGFRYMTDKEFRVGVRESGATVAEAMQMLTGHETKGFGATTTKFIMTPFSAINRANKALAASTAKDWIPVLYKTARDGGLRSGHAKRQLKSMGIDWNKPLTKAGEQKGAFRFASDTQLQKEIFKEPIWMNDPKFRPFALFKRFGYRQFNFMRENVFNEIRHGNVAPLLRLGAGGYLGGKFVLWSKGQLKRILSGKPYEEKDLPLWQDIVNTYAAVGAMGMISDLGRSYSESPEKYRRDVASNILFQMTPVAIGDPIQGAESFVNIAGSKNILRQSLIELSKQTPLTRYLGGRLRDKKKKKHKFLGTGLSR